MKRTIVLITAAFPYYPGEEFLETEVPYLASQFDRVVIVPQNVAGIPREVPPGVEVETGLASALSVCGMRKVSRLPLHPLLACEAGIRGARRPLAFKHAVLTASKVAICQEWFSSFLASHFQASESVLFYSYWTTVHILGVRAAVLQRSGATVIVARCHNYDLYIDERGDPNWPFHEKVIDTIDRLFPVSEHGRKYLLSHYPPIESKVEVRRLGVDDFAGNDDARPPDTFTVCSCSGFTPVKRLHLLIEALGCLGQRLPELRIEWHHFGDGYLRGDLEPLVKSCCSKNVGVEFHGQMANRRLREFYRDHWIDVFVNTSSAEGVPVSIMEAQCAGIPVIATAVGGTPELVNGENGVLLPANPKVAEVAEALSDAVREPVRWLKKRKQSRQTWQTMSDAAANYGSLAKRLNELFEYDPNSSGGMSTCQGS